MFRKNKGSQSGTDEKLLIDESKLTSTSGTEDGTGFFNSARSAKNQFVSMVKRNSQRNEKKKRKNRDISSASSVDDIDESENSLLDTGIQGDSFSRQDESASVQDSQGFYSARSHLDDSETSASTSDLKRSGRRDSSTISITSPSSSRLKKFSSSKNPRNNQQGQSSYMRQSSSASFAEKDKKDKKDKRKSLGVPTKDFMLDSFDSFRDKFSSSKRISIKTKLEFELKKDCPLVRPADPGKLNELMGKQKHCYYLHNNAVWFWHDGSATLTSITSNNNLNQVESLFPKGDDEILTVTPNDLNTIDALDSYNRHALRLNKDMLLLSFNNGSVDYETIDKRGNLIFGSIQNKDMHFEAHENTTLDEFKDAVDANDQVRVAIIRNLNEQKARHKEERKHKKVNAINKVLSVGDKSHPVPKLALELVMQALEESETSRNGLESVTSRVEMQPETSRVDVESGIDASPRVIQMDPVSYAMDENKKEAITNYYRNARQNPDFETRAVRSHSAAMDEFRSLHNLEDQNGDKTLLSVFATDAEDHSGQDYLSQDELMQQIDGFVSELQNHGNFTSPNSKSNSNDLPFATVDDAKVNIHEPEPGLLVPESPQKTDSTMPTTPRSELHDDHMRDDTSSGEFKRTESTELVPMEEPGSLLTENQQKILDHFDLFCDRYQAKNSESRNDTSSVNVWCFAFARPKYGENGIKAMRDFREKFVENIHEISETHTVRDYVIDLVLNNQGLFGILNNSYGPKSFRTHLLAYLDSNPDSPKNKKFDVDLYMTGFLNEFHVTAEELPNAIRQRFEEEFVIRHDIEPLAS